MNLAIKWLAAIGLCLASTIAAAQTKPADTAAPAAVADTSANFDGRITEASKIPDADQKFRALRSIRGELTRAIDETKAQRSALQDEISRLVAARKDLLPQAQPLQPGTMPEPTTEKVESDIKERRDAVKTLTDRLNAIKPGDASWPNMNTELQNARGALAAAENYLSYLKGRKELADKQAKELMSLDTKLDGLRAQEAAVDKTLKKLIASQSGLDDEINDTLRTDGQRNSFKSEIAFAFALLVAAVIGGFFMIAWRDEKVRQAIFSSESGIQFLTLFSVVIAIILFGITGILESKELAALLGGLSGYILGRVTSK